MRIKEPFILREIAGETLLVPAGGGASQMNGIITVNEVGAFLWALLQEEQTEDTLLQAILEEYDISPDIAQRDIQAFLQTLRENDLLL